MNIKNSVEELIGHTPLVRVKRYEGKVGAGAALLCKYEAVNPGGSIKDRVALEMMNEAERSGKLKAGGVIVEPTSGNTGIGLCAIGAARGYRVIIVMPETMSEERKKLMRAFGAELVLTDGKLGMTGSINKAKELCAEIPGAYMPGQFDNPANPQAHKNTTGPEILEDTEGDADVLVCGIGTGGTVTGIGEYLKEHIKGFRVVGVEPVNSAVLSGGKAGAHGLQGIGAGFIPSILNTDVYDEIIPVSDEDAYAAARLLATSEGLLCGITSGAALHAATLLSRRPEYAGKKIVVILPDTGDRYLSTPLYS